MINLTLVSFISATAIIILGFLYLCKYKKINLFKLFNEENKEKVDLTTKIIVVIIISGFAFLLGLIKTVLNIGGAYFSIIIGILQFILLFLGATVLSKSS